MPRPGHEVAEHEQPQVARRAQRLEVDHDARAAGHGPEPTRRRRRSGARDLATSRRARRRVDPQPVVQRDPRRAASTSASTGSATCSPSSRRSPSPSRRWEAQGGSRELVQDVALWGFPAGIVGGRLYFLATSWNEVPDHWWGPFAVWKGGLGIWGGIALGTAVGIWRLRRAGADVPRFLDAAAPALLVAQAIGRIGNYFNQELYGRPTSLPWGLRDRPRAPARALRRQRHLPPHLPLRDHLEPGPGRLPGVAGPAARHPPARAVRALRRRLLGLPDLRGAAARRPGQARPRPAPELLHRRRAHRRGADVVRAHAAPCQGEWPP